MPRPAVRRLKDEDPETKLHAHRLLSSHWNRRQPVIFVRLLAAHDAVKLRLQRLGHGPKFALAHSNFIDRANRRDFGGSASEENFVGDVQRLTRNLLLHDLDAEVARDLQHRVPCDAWEHGVAEWSSMQDAIADDEQILARAFADVAVHIERDAFGVAIDDGFHLDELRVPVIRARLGHGGERVGCGPRPPTKSTRPTPPW